MEIHSTSSLLKLRFFSSKAPSMAFETYEYRHLDFFFPEPLICPETHHPPLLSVQIELTLNIGFLCIRHDCRTGELNGSSFDTSMSPVTLRFDLDLLRNYNQVRSIVAPALTRLGLNPTSRFSANLVQEIIEHGLRFGRCVPGGEGKVLRLRAEILAKVWVHVNNEEDSLNRALSESASEFEASNYGMVPAKESLVKKILKKVSVEVEKKDCMICLEELEVGLEASQMPCSHTFHYDCIEKWLKLSHYCPICRFEMPS